jgi:hypothetical protein
MEFLSPNYLSARNSDQGSTSQRGSFQREYTPIRSAVDSVTYIADHLRNEEADQQVKKKFWSPSPWGDAINRIPKISKTDTFLK